MYPLSQMVHLRCEEIRTFQLNDDDFYYRGLHRLGIELFIKLHSLHETSPSDTYCFTEPKRGMAVFNGILTGQCAEVTLPTEVLKTLWIYTQKIHRMKQLYAFLLQRTLVL